MKVSFFLPALAGHAFQQTALIGMLPVLSQELGLSQPQIGWAVAAGMATAALALPFLGRLGGQVVLFGGLIGLLSANIALIALVGAPGGIMAPSLALTSLIAIRSVQGLSAAGLLMLAQQASVRPTGTARILGKVQSMGGIGRILGALLLGPLAAISPLLPLFPAAIGTIISLALVRRAGLPSLRTSFRPPRLLAFRATILTQMAVGASQIGLAPLLSARLADGAIGATALAGICLASANLGLLLALRLIAPRARRSHARYGALCLALAAGAVPFADSLIVFASLSLLIGGSTALLFTLSLSDLMTREDYAQLQVTGWNGAIQIASLAAGVAFGAAFVAVSPAAPFALAALSGVALAVSPSKS
ncbi:hypothetical protein [Pontivivens ytuae]|uniref:MFS transporter n=1 Tax=Pontivivens ytuae TaxID=2789856 RepID=A0A7S9LV83_9RHOB|nr:hypothetical protein [Pontivivens ytuae]QPH55600.1 hypothetical protein I0K15_07670 [Pontivivens ytuae]